MILHSSLPVYPISAVRPMVRMRCRSERVTITTGKYAGHTGMIESDEYVRVYHVMLDHVMLDTEELVTVRCDQARVQVNGP